MAYDNHDDGRSNGGKKTYYVSVGAGQVLEDSEAAAYELVIEATGEEADRLREMFGELSSIDEAGAGHFGLSEIYTNGDERTSNSYSDTLKRIYRLLHDCGTESTKRHIESMGLL